MTVSIGGATVAGGITFTNSIVSSGLQLFLDGANPDSYSPNQFAYAVNMPTWFVPFGANNATLTADPTIDPSPARGVPLKMAVTGTDPYTGTYNTIATNISTAASGQTWTASVYVKASVATTGALFIFGANSSGGYIDFGAGGFNITTSWTRVSFTFAFTNPSVTNVQFRLDGPDSGGTGVNIWWDGAQLEMQSSASTFSKVYNQNGLYWYDISPNKYTATLVNGVTWTPSIGAGSVTFNGALSQYVNSDNPNLASSDYTVMGAARYSTVGSYNGRLISSKVNNWLLGHWGSTTQNYYAEGWVTSPSGSGPLDTNWRLYTGTGNIASDSYSFYVNNSINTTSAGGSAGPNGFRLGSIQGTGEFSSGYIGCVLVYNRILTTDEMTLNYNLLKARYGL
jgi:hypothetical protein